MALVFPTPAQAALQSPVYTFSPTSLPLTNSYNSNTYTYDSVRGVWLTTPGAVANAMPCSGGIFTGPVQFDDPASFCATPLLAPGVPLGAALDITYDNATSGLTATDVQAAIDELAGSSSAAIPCACLTAIGSLLTSDGAAPTALPVGTDGQILVADSGEALGLKWISQAPAGVSSVTGTSPIAVDNTDPINPVVGIDAASTAQAGAVQLYDNVDSTSTTEAATANAAKIAYDAAVNSVQSVTGTAPVQIDNTDPQNPDISVDAATTAAPGIVQLNDTVTSTSTTEAGTANAVKTAYDLAAAAVPNSTFTALGELVVGTGAATYVVLSPGANGEVLSADSGAPSGLSWVAAATGTVTSITAGVGLNGGTITTSGTIDLADTAVVPGSYTYSSFTVDQQGRITAASNGATPVLPADFTAKGDILAADAAGSFVALGVGTDGQILIADSTEASGLKWISQTPAGVSSVTGTSPIVVNNGDPANPVVGIDAASTTQPGAVQLNDTVTSTSTTEAATANALKTAYDLAAAAVPDATFTAKGEVVVGTGASAYVALAPTADGQILVADAAEASGLKWVAQAPGGVQSVTGLSPIVVDNTDPTNPVISAPVIPDATFTAAGELIVGAGAASYVALTPGTNGQILVADSGETSGLKWAAACQGTVTNIATGTGLTGGPITATGTIALADTAVSPGTYSFACISVDQQGRLTAASSGPTPVLPANFDAKGDLLVGTADNAYSALPVGADGYVLTALSGVTEGVAWCPICGTPATPVVLGTVFACTTNTANGNVSLGYCAGYALGAASQSVAIGTCAIRNTNSAQNVAIGHKSGAAVSTAACNVFLGTCSGAQITTGCNNVVIGNQATPAANGDSQLVIGNSIGGTQCHWIQGDGSYNVVIPKILKPVGGICDCANAIGTAGQVLASTGSGVEWVTNAAADAIPCAAFDAKGDLLVGTGSDTFVALPVGGDGLVLTANSACTEGVEWVAASSGGPAEPLVQGSVYGCVTNFSDKNAAIGYNALQAASPGSTPCNSALGYEAGYSLDFGTENVAIGAYALRSGDSASCNTAVGLCSLYAITSGECNVSIGHLAGCNLTTGNRNTLLGQRAGFNVSTGCLNVVIGPGTQVPNGGVNCQLAIGPGGANYWLSGGADLNIQPGAGILDCTGVAGTAGQVLSSTGANALEWINAPAPSGAFPTIAGALYGRFGNAADKNASVGYGSLNTTIAGGARCNAALGWEAAFALNSGSCNVAVGMCSLRCTTSGCGNTAVGTFALCGATSGLGNTAVGLFAGKSVGVGSLNTFVGLRAGCAAVSAGANVVVGGEGAVAMTNGNCNIIIGMLAACNLTTGNRNVVLGPITCVPNPTGDCQLVIGFGPTDYWLTGCSNKNIRPGAGILDCANSAGTLGQSLWTTGSNAIVWSAASPSDARDKVIHGAIETALPVINQLEPVSYSWAPRDTGRQQDEIIYGFVAQQLQEVDPTLVDASDEEHLRIHDRKIVPLLVKAIQELSAQVTELKAEVETLKNQ